MEYSYEQINDSFKAIWSFLRANNYRDTNRKFINCKFMIDNSQSFINEIEFECRDYIDNPSYILFSNIFKANGYYRPVWSSYHLFSWNEEQEELTVELEGKKYIIKHV